MLRRKRKTDFEIHVSNPDIQWKDINIWDSLTNDEKKSLPHSFIVGSIKIVSHSRIFFHNKKINLGDKDYLLSHYLVNGESNICLIYNFEKGFLAPLNIPLSFSTPIIFNVPGHETVSISFSIVS